jgi:hypothetical protein
VFLSCPKIISEKVVDAIDDTFKLMSPEVVLICMNTARETGDVDTKDVDKGVAHDDR